MKKLLLISSFLGAASVGLSTLATASATVDFVKPDSFSDVPFAGWERDEVLKELKAHFEKLAAKLPANQDLKIEVLDVDLAGRIEPNFRAGRDLRILRGAADWPRISLKYTLTDAGKAVKSGEERVADMNYLNHLNQYPSAEPLRYEKSMLDSWFRKTLLAP